MALHMRADAKARGPIEDLQTYMANRGAVSASARSSTSHQVAQHSQPAPSGVKDVEGDDSEYESEEDRLSSKRLRTESPVPRVSPSPELDPPNLSRDDDNSEDEDFEHELYVPPYLSPTSSPASQSPLPPDVPRLSEEEDEEGSSSDSSSSDSASSATSSDEPRVTHDPDQWMEQQREAEREAETINPGGIEDDTTFVQPQEPVPPFLGLLAEESEIPTSRIEHIEIVNHFIRDIRQATLENGGLPEHLVELLNNPLIPSPDDQHELSDNERLQLDMYLATSGASESVYNSVVAAHNRRYPNSPLPSLYLARQYVERITGVTAIEDDMCINSCLAYVGPFKELANCPTCGESRTKRDEKNRAIPRRKATTLPLGPQLQAVIRSELGATQLQYRHLKTQQVRSRLASAQTQHGSQNLDVYDDIFASQDYLEMYEKENLIEDDILVGFSIDGAQLYQKKESDTWIAVWIVQNYDPKVRFKRKFVLPALIVPGPKKPKNIDSFMYRSFHHLSALQRTNNGKGMKAFNARKKVVTHSRIFLYLGTADAVALTEIDGRVGHHGANGCRIGCPMKGRHKPNAGHYYAAHNVPNNYTIAGCLHPDIDVAKLPSPTPEIYHEHLKQVTQARSQTSYEEARLKTGISKPTILSGLRYLLPIPKCFSLDLMHLFFINCGELLIPLWRGTLSHDKNDDPTTWPWRCLIDDKWVHHGALVASATKYFPTLFHRPPRNPAEKINSGYKATEYYLYIFGLGPAFFRTLLPDAYWRNFCSLVRGVRIVVQRRITATQLRSAQRALVQFVKGFEILYYQRRVDRLHFCRPWIHTLLHCVSETMRVGPGAYYTQFTTERAIGYLGGEIRQNADPFANLARIAERQAQQNALRVIYPELDTPKPLPQGSLDCGNGYVLLPPRSRSVDVLSGAVGLLLREEHGTDTLRIWGKLWIPKGQKVRSLYAEQRTTRENTRISRNAKIYIDNEIRMAEVQFYFLANERNPTSAKAVVSLYSTPDQDLYQSSQGTLYACSYHGPHTLRIIPISSIISLVSMQPMPSKTGERNDLWFPVEKSGLEDGEVTGYTNDLDVDSDGED